ncbi:ABC transporter ATP-binding protein [Dactylosporangium sp. NPDC051485]|uniref:ABC transporter ATP-binding protein n=1 Tax=Dactylosporangium sp. NPDC051485 TaxID=3154846 RepID=UPI00341C0B4D
MSAPMLDVQNLELRFGGVRALAGLSFQVERGRLCAVVGPNGAGKSSLFNCIGGLYRPQAGRILVDGVDVLNKRPHAIARLGVGRTFQNLALFPRQTVLENVLLGGYNRHTTGLVSCATHALGQRRKERRLREEAFDILERLELGRFEHSVTASLPFGILKRVELARALMSRPRLLLLDEPAAGLSHGLVAEFGQCIVQVREAFDVTIVLVEHHMGLVMSISDTVVVLNLGTLLATGTPDEVSHNPAVIEAYLGVAA